MQNNNFNHPITVQTQLITVGSQKERPKTGQSLANKQCRICLQSEDQNSDSMISPCSCTGSVQYIHTSCFNIWISKKYEDPEMREQIINNKGFYCELCKEKYQFSYQIEYVCVNWNTFKQKIFRKKFLMCATMVFLIINIILLSVVSEYAYQDGKNPQFDISLPRFFLVYVALTFASCSLIYGLYQFAKIFLIEQRFSLTPQNKQKDKKIRNRKQNNESTRNSTIQDSQIRFKNKRIG